MHGAASGPDDPSGALRTFLEAMELDLSTHRRLRSSPTLPRASLSPSQSPLSSRTALPSSRPPEPEEQQRLINVDDESN